LDVDIIGMTNMPEAKLAREAEICYSTLALSTDYDCWHEDYESVTVDKVVKTMNENIDNAKKVIYNAINKIPDKKDDYISDALKSAIISSIHSISEESKEKLAAIIKRYLLS
jgi:5'-methylthioadenosine phosphorylase